MKKFIKIIISIIIILITIILLDTLQARIFKTSPFISYKVTLEDNDSWVDKGLIMDTFYCTKDSDIVTISWHFKNTKYTCPIDNNKIINPEVIPFITMTIKEGTLTRTGATIIITDKSGKNNTYGEYYRIDKKNKDTWEELEVIIEGNYGFNSKGYYIGNDNTLEISHNWEWLYGELEEGIYRIVKEVNNNYFSVSFEISNLEDNKEKLEFKDSKADILSDDNTSEKVDNTPTESNNNNAPQTNENGTTKPSEKLTIKTITDKTKPNTSCAQAIDIFYEDSNYKYYYNCLKSQNIIVEYTNGTKENIKIALKNKHIKITDLDNHNIHYLKSKKQTYTK